MGSKRNAGLDLLRVVSMLLIVVTHLMIWGLPFAVEKSSLAANNVVFVAMSSLTSFGVNAFVLISGYYLSRSTIFKWDKVVRIWLQMAFYSLLIWLLMHLSGRDTSTSLLEAATPFYHDEYWFITQYVIMLLLAPFMARLCQALEQRQFLLLLLVMFLLFGSIIGSFPLGEVLFPGNKTKLFILLFFIGGYVARFELPKWIEDHCGKIALALLLLQIVGGLAINMIKDDGHIYGAFGGLAVFTSLFVFLWFRKLDVDWRWPSMVAPLVLGVYLIHDNPLLRSSLWGMFDMYSFWGTGSFWLIGFGACVAIFVACCLVDAVRKLLFDGVERLLIKK